jgi:hypothetical protein
MNEIKKLLNYLRNMPPPPKLSSILNPEIDKIFHPLGERDKNFYIIDTMLHFMIEQGDSLMLSVHKFIKYNMNKLIGERNVK